MELQQLLNNPFQLAEPYNKFSAYIDLVLLSGSKYNKYYPNTKYDENTMQLLISEKALAGRWQWSVGKVRRYLEECETLQLIRQLKGTNEKIILIYTAGTTTTPENSPNTAKINAFKSYIYEHYETIDRAILDDFVKYWTRILHGVPRFENYMPFDYDEKIQYFITHRKPTHNKQENNSNNDKISLSWEEKK